MAMCPILYASDNKMECKQGSCEWWDSQVSKCAVLAISHRLEAIRPLSALLSSVDSIARSMPK